MNQLSSQKQMVSVFNHGFNNLLLVVCIVDGHSVGTSRKRSPKQSRSENHSQVVGRHLIQNGVLSNSKKIRLGMFEQNN